MSIDTIPLKQLVPSEHNPRTVRSPDMVERMAASILRHGLLQNLVVEGPDENNHYGVIEGETRRQAMQHLVDSGKVPEDILVPCSISKHPDEDGLAANSVRFEMTPPERVRAYSKLEQQGQSPDEIARHFGHPVDLIRRTLKLGHLPDEILDAWTDGHITEPQAMAFAVANPEAALALFQSRKPDEWSRWDGQPHQIKHQLTEKKVLVDSRMGRFVTRAAYETEGGTITDNLFGDEAWFDDAALVRRLFNEKMVEHERRLKKEGWKWVRYGVDAYDVRETLRDIGFRMIHGELLITDEELEELEELEVAEEQDNPRRIKLTEKAETEVFTDDQKSVAGVLIFLGYEGEIILEGGYVLSQDFDKAIELGVLDDGADLPKPKEVKEEGGYNQALLDDLKDVKRLALQSELVEKPEVLLDLLAQCFLAEWGYERPLDIQFQEFVPSEKLLDMVCEPNKKLDIGEDAAIDTKKARNAVIAAGLARLVKLTGMPGHLPNIRKWWTPSEQFFKRLNKAQLIEVACDIGAGQARTWDKMKKAEIVDLLADVFAGNPVEGRNITPEMVKEAKSWLPEPLRAAEKAE